MIHICRSSAMYKVNIVCEEELAAHHAPEVPQYHLKPLFWTNTSSMLFLKTPGETIKSMGHTKYYIAHLSHLTIEKKMQNNQCTISGISLHENWIVIKYCSSTTVIFKSWYFSYTVKLSVCSDFSAFTQFHNAFIHSCYSFPHTIIDHCFLLLLN